MISLLLGAQQLTSRIRDSLNRSRETATLIEVARAQASRREFAEAWKSLDRALALNPGETAESARVEIGCAWLQDAQPGPGQRFSLITDAVTPALDRALLNAHGTRRADILAHLGWATFLRWRDGISGDPAARYQEALSVDPTNAFANAMLGHWLMWGGANVDAARERFDTALEAGGATRAFVRRLQVASLVNKGGDAEDAELLRVANDMRQRTEPLALTVANQLYWIYTLRWGPNARPPSAAAPAVAPADFEATYEWVLTTPGSGQRSPDVSAYVRGMLQEAAGHGAAALATFRSLQQRQALPPAVRDQVQKALVRLATAPAVQSVAPDIPRVVVGGTKVELVKDGFAGADDPIAVPGVGLVFSEPDASRILSLDEHNRIATLVEQSNESHGMTLDSRSRLISAQSRDGQTRIGVIYPRGVETVIADTFEGKPFSRPNDLIVDKKGGIYFTDPGLNGAQAEVLRKAQGGRPLAARLPPAVYYIPAGGKAIKIADRIERPNGIQLSRDERTLYVNNTNGVYLLAFDIQSDGTVRNRRNFGTYDGRSRFPNGLPGIMTGADGLTIDNEGRLYGATAAGVEIFSAEGQHLGTIPLSCGGMDCQGVAFGGTDKKTLYIAGHGSLFKIRMLAKGFTGRAK